MWLEREFLLGNRISLPRGYNNIISTDLGLISIDYVMPLIYPDFNISSLLYIKRIRSGYFYDQVSGPGNSYYVPSTKGFVPLVSNTEKKTFSSAGFELMADYYVLRIPFMISTGVQVAWKTLSEKPYLQLLFNIDLFGMSVGKRQFQSNRY